MSANFTFTSAYHDVGAPEPITRPDLFEGILWRRAMAYLIDACCIGAIVVVLWFFFLLLTVLSFGVLGPVLWFLLGLVPLTYHTLLVSGPHSATLACAPLACNCIRGTASARCSSRRWRTRRCFM